VADLGDSTPELQVERVRSGAAAVLVLRGEHDLATKDDLSETLRSLIETHRVVVADLSEAEYVDSSTLAELVRADRAARAAGKHFRLQLGTEPIVERVLEISGLLNVLDVYPTRDAALDATPDKPPDRLL
jgi:anti-anti-sigma factor